MLSCVSLYDESGNMLRPWAEAGYDCHCIDLEGKSREEIIGKGKITFHQMDCLSEECRQLVHKLHPYFMFGFPPCTDVAVSGAKHFEKKMMDDPYCMAKAADLAFRIPLLAHEVGAIWGFENPKSMLKHYIGAPDHIFNPWEFGGYLPEDDVHPRWPDFIAPRDAYPKETWLWVSPKFKFPRRRCVYCPPGYSTQHTQLGGKSEKTKQIRSETPRGFAIAVFLANRSKEL